MNRRIIQLALVGALSVGAGAQAGAAVIYHGGRVIPSVRIVPIFYGSSWTSTDITHIHNYLFDIKGYLRAVGVGSAQRSIYAQYGVADAQLDLPLTVADGSPRQLSGTEVLNIIHAFQSQNANPYGPEKVFVLLPGPGYTSSVGPCGYKASEGDGKYFAVVPTGCATYQRTISILLLGTAISPNLDGWDDAIGLCLGHTVTFGQGPDHGEIALPWDNLTGGCVDTPYDNRANQILQVVATTPAPVGGLFHALQHTNGTWSAFGDVKNAAGSNPGVFGNVDSQATLGVFNHVIAVTGTGKLFHTIRTDSGWTPFVNVNAATGAGSTVFTKVGLADVNGDLHVCAISSDGGVWHAIRYQNMAWTGFGNVLGQTGSPGSNVIDVDCAGIGGDMHIAMTTAAGGLHHSIRFSTGGWQALGDVKIAAGQIGSAVTVTVTNLAGELSLATRITNGTQFHTIRHANSWDTLATPQNNFLVDDQTSTVLQNIIPLPGSPVVALMSIVNNGSGAIRLRTRNSLGFWISDDDVTAKTGWTGQASSIGVTTSLGF